MALRVPAGVYVNGRPMGGRFVSRNELSALARRADGDGAERLLGFVYEQLDKAVRAQERVERKFQDDPKRYAAKRAQAENDRLAWERVSAEIEAVILPPDEKDLAVEWELGFDYNGASSDKDFDLNVRLIRVDRRPFDLEEAESAFRDVMRNAMVPPGYLLASIDWRRPRKGTHWKSGGVDDLDAFSAPMYVHHDDERSVVVTPAGQKASDTRSWDFGRHFRLGSVRR